MATQENFDRLYRNFRTKFRNQPQHVQEAIIEEARQGRLAEAERRGRPLELANANIGSLAALRATAKDPFAQKRVPENVEGEIARFLGVLPYNRRINNTRTRRVYPTRENAMRGILEAPTTRARQNAARARVAREKAATLARKHEAAMNAYMMAKLTEEERAKEGRAAAKQKSRSKRGHHSINRRVFNNTKTSKRRVPAYVNSTRNKRKAGDKKKRNLTHRQRIIEKYIKQSINNNENN
jgi:hypothetical protein